MEPVEIDEDVKAFLIESYENLDEIEKDALTLEKTSSPDASLVRIYRALHTLKGNCGFLPFPKLESVAHASEDLLSSLRDRPQSITPSVTQILLQTIDAIRQILAHIEATGQEGEADYADLIQALLSLKVGESPPAIAGSVVPQSYGLERSPMSPRAVALPSIHTVDPVDPLPEVESLTSEPKVSAASESCVRVDVGLLDQIMNLVGELILTRNQITKFSTTCSDPGFAFTYHQLEHITTQLQERVMQTRLQSIDILWQKLPRVVHDLAIASGKQVQVELSGAQTELDKSILEAIKDPLMHLVRNCIDHGIESPSERLQRGKPAAGRLSLQAFHSGGKVNIEIGDDGRGLDPEHLKQSAQKLGLVSPTQADDLNQAEIFNLIFQSGFSTASQVTRLSGRGVGMDIVRNKLEQINGTIEVHSQVGQGTTFKLKIPLTLTIIPSLIVSSGGGTYAIPQSSLQELIRIEREQATSRIEILYNVPVYRWRDRLLPLVYLNPTLNLPDPRPVPEMLSIVVMALEEYRFGLVVDQIEDIQDIVVKPLGHQLKSMTVFSGATILGDGKIALILDGVGLAKSAGVTAQLQHDLSLRSPQAPALQEAQQLILLFQGPEGARMGIPMAIASRLEEIPRSRLEKVGNQWVVQYRNQVLPLIDLQALFAPQPKKPSIEMPFQTSGAPAADLLRVIVVSPSPNLSLGLVVEQMLDIVEASLEIKGAASRPGILFNTVIQGQATEILDLKAILQMANPHFLQLI